MSRALVKWVERPSTGVAHLVTDGGTDGTHWTPMCGGFRPFVIGRRAAWVIMPLGTRPDHRMCPRCPWQEYTPYRHQRPPVAAQIRLFGVSPPDVEASEQPAQLLSDDPDPPAAP